MVTYSNPDARRLLCQLVYGPGPVAPATCWLIVLDLKAGLQHARDLANHSLLAGKFWVAVNMPERDT